MAETAVAPARCPRGALGCRAAPARLGQDSHEPPCPRAQGTGATEAGAARSLGPKTLSVPRMTAYPAGLGKHMAPGQRGVWEDPEGPLCQCPLPRQSWWSHRGQPPPAWLSPRGLWLGRRQKQAHTHQEAMQSWCFQEKKLLFLPFFLSRRGRRSFLFSSNPRPARGLGDGAAMAGGRGLACGGAGCGRQHHGPWGRVWGNNQKAGAGQVEKKHPKNKSTRGKALETVRGGRARGRSCPPSHRGHECATATAEQSTGPCQLPGPPVPPDPDLVPPLRCPRRVGDPYLLTDRAP